MATFVDQAPDCQDASIVIANAIEIEIRFRLFAVTFLSHPYRKVYCVKYGSCRFPIAIVGVVSFMYAPHCAASSWMYNLQTVLVISPPKKRSLKPGFNV